MDDVKRAHRDLKVQRLRDALARVSSLIARAPELQDAEFAQWHKGTVQILRDLFAETHMLGYVGRFTKIHFRSTIASRRAGGLVFHTNNKQVWRRGLTEAETVLREALEEAELGPPPERRLPVPPPSRSDPAVVIHVTNTVSNAFSASLHVTFAQLMSDLDARELDLAEKESARAELVAIEEETKGQQRWPVIARSLDAIKGMGKGIYKDIAVPLIVEFLKQQSGLTAPPR